MLIVLLHHIIHIFEFQSILPVYIQLQESSDSHLYFSQQKQHTKIILKYYQ